MSQIELISKHPDFKSLRVTHWMNGETPMFGVSCGSSFSEFYSEFSAKDYFQSLDKDEIQKFMARVNGQWFIELLTELASGESLTSTQIQDRASIEQNH